MGNTSSGQGEKRSWPQHELRPPPRLISELSSKQKLRPTENGVIMHNGGTISIRKQLHSNKFDGSQNESYNNIQGNFYGSEPDLRQHKDHPTSEIQARYKISRSRKKYKAPPAPPQTQVERSSPDSYQQWERRKSSESQPRRLRLFRTRAETKRRIADENLSSLPPLTSLHRSLSTPHLEVELTETDRGEKVKDMKIEEMLKQHICSIEEIRHPRNEADIQEYNVNLRDSIEVLSMGREEEENSWNRIPSSRPSGPVKTFYFGMNTESDMNDPVLVEKFVEKIQHISQMNTTQTMVSSSSSESLDDFAIDEKARGIYVHLRATLPRKQLDIPRFSPTTAWRLLSALESPPPIDDDDSLHTEERIPNLPLPLQISSHLDKSADSGISGDASPQHHDSTHNSQTAWTPQQDLEETSSEGGLDSIPVSPESITKAKFSPRFSLSLPRDNRLKLHPPTEKVDIIEATSLHNLKKLKRSISGVLGKGNFLKEDISNIPDSQQLLDTNWVLSRSVPSSLNIVHASLQKQIQTSSPETSQEKEVPEFFSTEPPSFLHLATGGHIMYLPSYTTPRERSSGALALSKSCEDLSYSTENHIAKSYGAMIASPKGNGGRKFTFQSTIRQLERKRIAEKLSKQAESRERERLSEMLAMQRVEEEFQRKREREKADIRQQLRLYSIKQHEREKLDSLDFPPQATQVLSEFRQTHRDYRDYRTQRSLYESDSASPTDGAKRRETIHPEVVYKIPKSTQVYIGAGSNSHVSG